jgi:hypothetical protein
LEEDEMKKLAGLTLALLLSTAFAAEAPFGVDVYPGARPAPEVAESLKAMNSQVEAKTYRTADAPAKVAAFYGQRLKAGPGNTDKSGMFMAPGAMVTVQNPWLDMKTSKVQNDTLITIMKQPKS